MMPMTIFLQDFKNNFEGCVAAIRKSVSSGNRKSSSERSYDSGFSTGTGSDSLSSNLYSLVENIPRISLSEMTTSAKRDADSLSKIIFDRETNVREFTAGRFADSIPDVVDLNLTMCGFLLPSHLKWPFLSGSMKQEATRSPNLLFCRLSGSHPALHRETLRLVNQFNRHVVVVGASVS